MVNRLTVHAVISICLLAILLLPLSLSAANGYPSFQELIDAADPKAILVPPPGIYSGPVTIEQPIAIDGRGEVTIDAGGKGSVIYLETDGATIKNLHLTNTGESHNDLDAGIQVRGNFNVIKENVIDNALFGIDLQQSNNNIVQRNHISSKPFDLGVRGDSVRLWYSFKNKITDNIIRDSRDMVVWYSADNLIAGNDSRRGRYSLHFMYSKHNEVVDNHYENNAVGIFLMYSDGVHVKDNYIAHAQGSTGMGIGFKETSDVEITGNRILYCGTGIYLDISPYDPEATNRLKHNLIAYNGVGVMFLNDWQGNVLEANSFKGNITQVVVSGGGKTANRNIWRGNYWDDYEGFDQDQNGVGDKPYELYSYADRIWMDVPPARFFKGSPVLEVMDFLERLAPFTDPNMLVRDKQPMIAAGWEDKDQIETVDTPGEGPVESAPDKADAPAAFDAYKALRDSLGH